MTQPHTTGPEITETPIGDGRKQVEATATVTVGTHTWPMRTRLLVSEKVELVPQLAVQDNVARLDLCLGGVAYARTIQVLTRPGDEVDEPVEVDEQPYWWDE